MPRKTYSISELATQLQLPRTTINDWLKNFAPYLEYEMKGKRKEYNQNALNVLKNISKWKNDGKSASAIQKLLEENYGILGEIDSSEEPAVDTAAESQEQKTAVQENSDELMQVVHSDLEMLLANMEQLNTKRIKSTRRAALVSVIIMFFILLGVAGAAYFIYINMLRIRQENAAAKQEYSKRISIMQQENKQQLDELNKLRKIELDKIKADSIARDKGFRKEIEMQKSELIESFKSLKKSVAAQRELELIKLREKFAAEQKVILEKLVAKEKELTTVQNKLENLQSHADSLQKNSENLQKQTAELKAELAREQNNKKQLQNEYNALKNIIDNEEQDNK